jgi:hypothetical protein
VTSIGIFPNKWDEIGHRFLINQLALNGREVPMPKVFAADGVSVMLCNMADTLQCGGCDTLVATTCARATEINADQEIASACRSLPG